MGSTTVDWARKKVPLEPFPAVGHDDDTNVCGSLDDLKNWVTAQDVSPRKNLRTSGEDMCDPIATAELEDHLRHVLTFEDSGLDVQVPGKV